MLFQTAVILSILNFFNSVIAWGPVGHQLSGALASKMMSAEAQKVLENLFPSDWKKSLGYVATWADIVKGDEEYAWTRELHYIDAADNPPADCNINYERDCPDGNCVVGGIALFSKQLVTCSNSLQDRIDAAKFIVHFIGDLTQPLHTCARERGGNDVTVKFGKKKAAKLHAVWDGDMVTKRLNDDFEGSFVKYLDFLYTKSAQLNDPELSQCLNNADLSDSEAMKKCVMSWSEDSNAVNCKAVWPAFDKDPKQDFSKKYYTDSIPIIENQIIKAGIRMAKFFNNLKDCPEDAGKKKEVLGTTN